MLLRLSRKMGLSPKLTLSPSKGGLSNQDLEVFGVKRFGDIIKLIVHSCCYELSNLCPTSRLSVLWRIDE
jgi:hypothetical protein